MQQIVIFAIAFCTFSINIHGQDISGMQAAIRNDSLFWQAYNHCDVEGMMAITAADIHFFHDKGGITLGDSAFRVSITKGLCGNSDYKTRREKLAGTEGVYPMSRNGQLYGVLFTGKHLFHLTEKNKAEYPTGVAQYADLWLLQNGKWKLAHVFSYDHQPYTAAVSRKSLKLSREKMKIYEGKYKGPQTTLVVKAMNDSLTLEPEIGQAMTVYPESKTVFFSKERDLTFTFEMKGNKVSSMIVHERGQEAERLTPKP